jgi:adenylosuccinate lyase
MVAGYAEAAAENWDAHSLEHSSAERVVIPQISELAGFMLTEVADIAETLVLAVGDISNNVRLAPDDSYKQRNRLIREGMDGGEAYEASRADSSRVNSPGATS